MDHIIQIFLNAGEVVFVNLLSISYILVVTEVGLAGFRKLDFILFYLRFDMEIKTRKPNRCVKQLISKMREL